MDFRFKKSNLVSGDISPDTEGILNLAAAIVQQAKYDYVTGKNKIDVLLFLHSDLFSNICAVAKTDPETVFREWERERIEYAHNIRIRKV